MLQIDLLSSFSRVLSYRVMSCTYTPSFLRNKDTSRAIDEVNEREKNTFADIDMSRLSSAWLRNVMVYVAQLKTREDDEENCFCFDAYRDHPRVPTCNV